MRALGIASAIALTMVVGSTVAGVAVADDDTMPSRRDVHEARVAARRHGVVVGDGHAGHGAADHHRESDRARYSQCTHVSDLS